MTKESHPLKANENYQTQSPKAFFITIKVFLTFFGNFQAVVRTSFFSRVVTISNNPKREVLGTSKITHKNQVTIPKQVRQRFDLEKGETLVFMDQNNKLIVKKSTEV